MKSQKSRWADPFCCFDDKPTEMEQQERFELAAKIDLQDILHIVKNKAPLSTIENWLDDLKNLIVERRIHLDGQAEAL